jgi:DNA-binding NarL/FixJ family response regulator
VPFGGTVADGSHRHITLLICDDHRLLTESLAMVVEAEEDIDLVGDPVDDPGVAIDLVRAHHPDVVLMDVGFKTSQMNGFDATRRIKEASPTTNVIIMTASDDESALVAGVEAGAAGFLNKTEAVDEVMDAVRGAAEGEVLIDPALLAKALQHVARDRETRRQAEQLLGQLTERELEVLRLLAQGNRNEAIAEKLFISQQTVQTHVRNILAKLRVHSKLEAVSFAVRHGAVQV